MTAKDTVLVAHPGAELYGSDRVLIETVAALIDDGRAVTVALPTDGPLRHELEVRGADVRICVMPVARRSALRPRGAVRLVRDALAGFRAGRRLIREVSPACIYVNTLTIPLWLVLARLARIPSVAHVHESEQGSPRIVRDALAAPLLLADTVVANSRFSAGVLSHSFRRLHSAEVVYNGVRGPVTRRRARPSLDGALRVVYVGRLSERKGPDLAVAAVSLLHAEGREISLDLVGSVFPGYEAYEERLRSQVQDGGLQDVVHFRGFQSDVWEEIDHGDILVVPSRAEETFGNTAVEGILAARPVVVAANTGLLEASRGYGAVRTFENGDARGLADALRDIHDDWASIAGLAWADASTAEARHSPQLYRRRIRQIVAHTQEAA